MSASLAKLDKARSLLAEVATADEALELRDQAEAIRHYLSKKRGAEGAAAEAAEIVLRAARRVGELLPPKGEGHGGAPDRGSKVRGPDLDKRRASEFRRIASYPSGELDDYIAAQRATHSQPTAAEVLRRVKRSEQDRAIAKVGWERTHEIASRVESLICKARNYVAEQMDEEPQEVVRLLEDVHERISGAHKIAAALAEKAKRAK